MAPSRRQPIKDAPRESRERLGMLLQVRREDDLGYGPDSRPAFEERTGVNRRMSSDVERARRDTFDVSTLRDLAEAYEVTAESMIEVAWGRTDELAPVVSANAGLATAAGQARPPSAVAIPSGLPSAPPSGLLREDAARPFAAVLWNRLMKLAARGVPDPDGRHPRDWDPDDWDSWNPSAEQLGLEGIDAETWNGSRGAMSLSDRGWLTGDWHARRAARDATRAARADSA